MARISFSIAILPDDLASLQKKLEHMGARNIVIKQSGGESGILTGVRLMTQNESDSSLEEILEQESLSHWDRRKELLEKANLA